MELQVRNPEDSNIEIDFLTKEKLGSSACYQYFSKVPFSIISIKQTLFSLSVIPNNRFVCFFNV